MLEEAIARYGYVILFIASGIEGDAALGAAAFLAQQGKLDPVWTFTVAILGSCLASEVSFRVGRSKGSGWIEQRSDGNPKLARVRGWIARRARLLVFASRFLWGFRLTIPALCGASGMAQPTFSSWNFAGAVVWGGAVGAGAYFFGAALERWWDDYSQHWRLVAGALFGVLFAIYLWRRRDRLAWRLLLRRPPSG